MWLLRIKKRMCLLDWPSGNGELQFRPNYLERSPTQQDDAFLPEVPLGGSARRNVHMTVMGKGEGCIPKQRILQNSSVQEGGAHFSGVYFQHRIRRDLHVSSSNLLVFSFFCLCI